MQAGLPVLTKPGDSFLSRMGTSLCASVGMPEMICEDSHSYEERAVELATQPAELRAMRQRLTDGKHPPPLFDLHGFAGQLETAYRAIWRDHVDGTHARWIRPQRPV